ncbi:unnamed protein product [Candida verbasci]|uniref:Helicase C-terminal domain-containing protein n=1 Tax=Candida verbasci TaxID=1227364 RepID=A0A9W4TVV3_9ASCO|nr:unnamed protein product [Candida verbasci]
MLIKESVPQKTIAPNLLQLKSIADQNFYLNLSTMAISVNPELIILPRGGILAENMGLGKTLICLSLICLTKFEIAKKPTDTLLYDTEDKSLVLKSLTEICRDVISDNSLPWKQYNQNLPESVVKLLSKSPGKFHVVIDDKPKSKRNIEDHHSNSRMLYMCSTTLIVVPDNLFSQWSAEMKKHLKQDYLKILFISPYFKSDINETYNQYTSNFLTALEMTQFDAVLLSNQSLKKSMNLEHQNPLNQVYWKRIIIDEGHSMNSKTSKIAQLSKSLYAERKWAVTGTPTSGLTRLDMDEENEVQGSQKPSKNKYMVKTKFDEKADLIKLGTIFSNFLNIEPFSSQPKTWSSQIIKPLIDEVYGSTITLSNLLNSIMVRHNLNEVEKDLKLPKLHHEIVVLKPSYQNSLSINLFNALLAVNAVTSERTDIDYMFHPNNRLQLRQLISNLQRATFYWTGFTTEEIKSLINICNNCLSKKKYSDNDTRLLHESIDVAQLALGNRQWRVSSMLHEMNYYVDGLPKSFVNSFGIGSSNDIGIFGAPHLNALQEFLYRNRFIDFDDKEKVSNKLEESSSKFWDRFWKENNDKKHNEKFGKQSNEISVENSMKNSDIYSPKSKKRNNSVLSREEVHKMINYGIESIDKKNTFDIIKKARILGTASSKLSYLSSKLLDHQRDKIKSIVFFEFEDSAYYLSELLDVLGVNYLLYATFINSTARAKNLSEFTNYVSDELGGITLIMDIRLAAHGLTIVSATRVYFMSPVWQQSVEAQAIKRAHRIGQTKEVFVETLLLANTLEEEIYKRRANQKESNSETNLQKYAIDDLGIQHYILQHSFLNLKNMGDYAPFVSTSSSHNEKETAEQFNLLRHESVRFENNGKSYKEWIIYLFNRENLAKFNNLKTDKLRDKENEQEFVDSLTTDRKPDVELIEKKRKSTFANQSTKKKVRF